jgi:carboxyl-terminal processing protease
MKHFRYSSNSGSWLVPLLVGLTLFTGVLAWTWIKEGSPPVRINPAGQTISTNTAEELLHYLDKRYYRKINLDSLKGLSIEEVVSQLDPYSQFIPAGEVKELQDNINGQFSGIGIEYTAIGDSIGVVRVIAGGPAYKAGIRAGDYIIGANQKLVTRGASKEEVVLEIKGEKDKPVSIFIDRMGVEKTMHFIVYRDDLKVTAIGASLVLNDSIVYVKLRNFNSNAYREFMEKIETLINEGQVRHLIFDLRGNPGGLLQEAVNILSQFFKEKGRLLVYTEGKNYKRSEYKTTGNRFFNIEKIAVLIDKQSASASEIVAGALQDLDRAVIIGQPTYGKGLVQEIFPLSDGSAVRLTVAKYYIPSGRSIQKPFQNDGFFSIDSSEVFRTSSGRRVFAHGGVEPDFYTTESQLIGDDSLNLLLLEKINRLSFSFFRENIDRADQVMQDLINKEDSLYNQIINKLEPAISAVYKRAESQVDIDEWVEFSFHRILSMFMNEEEYYIWLTESDKSIALAKENMFSQDVLRAARPDR